jgi:CheY-like chemotaxis protein
MKSTLKILLLEDSVADAELIAHELEAAGFAFRLARIQTEAELRREMATGPPDLILSDHGLPSFSGFAALEIVREISPELPFIFVSGSNDPGMVAEMCEEGATDYVYKRDIGDLKSAVLRALEPQLEVTPPPIEPEPLPSPRDFQPPAANVSARWLVSSPVIGQVWFCPQCRQAREETGRPVSLETYCGSHAETVIHRQLCAECNRPHQPR